MGREGTRLKLLGKDSACSIRHTTGTSRGGRADSRSQRAKKEDSGQTEHCPASATTTATTTPTQHLLRSVPPPATLAGRFLR